MKVIRLTAKNKHKVLHQALAVINRGGTIVYPTETSYGLGGDFFSTKAYAKVLDIKGRPKNKLLAVIAPDVHTARTLVKFSVKAENLAENFWPGPLTMVLPFKIPNPHPKFLKRNLGIRISSHPLARTLTRLAGRPLISTSANISGQPAVYTIKYFLAQMRGRKYKPDLIIDAGRLPEVFPSTIIKVDGPKIKVLRQGPIVIA